MKTFREFIEYARRANPPLAYASIGNGSQHHLAMEMLKSRAGINLLHVPFKGGGPALVGLFGGEVSVMFGGSSAGPHVRSGKLLTGSDGCTASRKWVVTRLATGARSFSVSNGSFR